MQLHDFFSNRHVEQGVWIDPADTLDVSVGKQILAFQHSGAFRQKHGGSDEAVFGWIVEFAVGLQNAFVDGAVVTSWW